MFLASLLSGSVFVSLINRLRARLIACKKTISLLRTSLTTDQSNDLIWGRQLDSTSLQFKFQPCMQLDSEKYCSFVKLFH